MPELVLKLGDNVLQTYVFDKDVMSIGRSRDNDIVVENLSVSRNHARIRQQNGKYILTDLNSANGTFVNGVRVSKTEVVNEDVISIGKHKLHFSNKAVDEEVLIADAFGADRTMVVDRAPVPVLCISEGKLKGQEFPITKFETTIGKAASNDIVLGDDWFLAKKQAILLKRGNHEYEIHDMGGFRRTKVNGVQISEPQVLKAGDIIEFGNTRCVFQVSGEKPAATGRIPQEMALEDSIFSAGDNYVEREPAQAARAAEMETPYSDDIRRLAAATLLPKEEEGRFDPAELARAAIAEDYRQMNGGATAENGSAVHQSEESAVFIPDVQDDLDAGFSEAPANVAADEDNPFESAFLSDHELDLAPADSAAEIQAGMQTAQLPAEMEYTGTGSDSSLPVASSASGGRSSRRKKRDRQSNGHFSHQSDEGSVLEEVQNESGDDGSPSLAPHAENPAPETGDFKVDTPGEINVQSLEEVSEVSAPPVDAAPQMDAPDEAELPAGTYAAPDFDIVHSADSPAEEIATSDSDPSPLLEAPAATHSVPADPGEIALWESALQNRSPVIRKQAAKMLKKLTGRDYEA